MPLAGITGVEPSDGTPEITDEPRGDTAPIMLAGVTGATVYAGVAETT